MLGLDIAYVHAKFDQSNFSHSVDIIGALQNLNDSRDLTTPLSGMIVIRGLAVAIIKLST